MSLYNKDRDNAELGTFYTEHVSAMTREGLHKKSDIASELAARDSRITALESALTARDTEIARLEAEVERSRHTLMVETERLRNENDRIAVEHESSVEIRDTEIARLQTDLELARIGERERNSLRDFANGVMESWPHGDVDGCDLEHMAVEHGLLALKDPRPTEPCGDNCACSGYPSPEEWAEGIDCYVRTPLLTGKVDAARAGNGGDG